MKNQYQWLVQKLKTTDQARPRHLIFAAAAFHLLTTTAVFLVGRFGLMPSQFGQTGISAFATDGNYYQTEINSLSGLLTSGRILTWLNDPGEFHTKLYSLSSAAFRPLTEFNVLTIEPLNNLYYILILVLVFKLGASAFGRTVGLVSAGLVAVWPTFLLHTTQTLRDPVVIVALLTQVLVICLALTAVFNWRRGIALGALAALSVALIWAIRLSMWDLVRAAVCLAVLLIVFRQLREKRLLLGNTLSLAVLGIAAILTPYLSRELGKTVPRLSGTEERRATWKGKPFAGLTASEIQEQLPLSQRISKKRQLFIAPNEEGLPPGSNIDLDVTFDSLSDIISFLPRATVVGLFSPFPNTWLGSGLQVGRAGRVLAGFETLLTYIFELLAVIGLWVNRHSLAAWFMFTMALLGCVSLGLIVPNIGTLYRLRYPFWILMVVLAAAGATQRVAKIWKDRNPLLQ